MRRILVDSTKCVGCHSCELACAVAHSNSGTLYGAVFESPPPMARVSVEAAPFGSFPLQCRHCEEPQCVKACVSKALYRDPETLAVSHSSELCIGCWMCAIACPFGSIERSVATRTVSKCDLCQGLENCGESPACVTGCPTGALSFDEVENFSRTKRQAYLAELDIKRGGDIYE